MIRRTLVIALFVLLVTACAATPALASIGPITGILLNPGAQLAQGADPVIAVWPTGGGATLTAEHFTIDGSPQTPHAVVSGFSSSDPWYASGHGTEVTVVWKDGDSVFAKCMDLDDGTIVFGPVTVCTDAAVTTLPGAATTASLSGVAADGSGGTYVWCTVSPTTGVSNVGDTLLNHVGANGSLSAADPGLAVAKGTVASLEADGVGHAFALLAPPGRNGLGVQRWSPALTADPGWSRPISPYSPLLPVPMATPQPIGISAGSGALIAWRENGKIKVQRYPSSGGLAWLRPAAFALAITTAANVKIAGDGDDGLYLAAPSGAGGITVRHVLGSGVASTAAALTSLGLTQAQLGPLTVNRAGDLFGGYGDATLPALGGIQSVTCGGGTSRWTPPALALDRFTAATGDGTGGAWLVGDGSSCMLWRVAASEGVTLRPRAVVVRYGKGVSAGGYVTDAGSLAASGAAVEVDASGGGSPSASATTQADGYYHVTIAPRANATWTASAAGVTSEGVVIRVMPNVSLALSHLKAGTRLTELLSGAVTPRHSGSKVLIQKAVGSDWRTVASGKLDGRSRYRIAWRLPYRTATYKLRATLPAHADHAEGASQTATLRVVIR